MKLHRSSIAVALAVAGAAVFGGAAATSASASVAHATAPSVLPPPDGGDNVEIVNGSGNQLCLDAETDSSGNPSENGDRVQLWSCTGGTNQLWRFVNNDDGPGEIINALGNKCLDAENDSKGNPTQNGDKIQLWTCTGALNQEWYPINEGGGYSILVNQDGIGGVLDAEADSNGNPNEDGDKIQIWTGTDGTNQDWAFEG